MALNVDDIKKNSKQSKSGYVEDEKIRTTIWVDRSKRNALKMIAVKKGVTLTSLLDEGLDMLLSKYV